MALTPSGWNPTRNPMIEPSEFLLFGPFQVMDGRANVLPLASRASWRLIWRNQAPPNYRNLVKSHSSTNKLYRKLNVNAPQKLANSLHCPPTQLLPARPERVH